MLAVVRDLRQSGGSATRLAICLVVVLLAAIVTASVRAGGDTSSDGARPRSAPTGWVRVVDRAVGFTGWFPTQPKDQRVSGRTADGLPVSLAKASHRIAIARIALADPSVTELTRVFRAAVDSLAWGAGFQVESEAATTFRGRVAREGRYVTDSGGYYRAMAFLTGSGDLYLIASPAKYFDAIAATFRVLG